MAQAHFRTLDAMRGVAAIAVVLFHARRIFPIDAASGYLAVDFFFVLSGFVVAHAYGAKLNSGMTFRDFFFRRCQRFYPLFLAGLIVGAVLALTVQAMAPADVGLSFALGLFFLPTPVEGEVFPLNGPYWSLFWELAINLVFAASLRFLSGRVLIACMGVGAIGIAVALAIHGQLNLGFEWEHAWVGAARVMFSFPAGVLLYNYRDRIPAAFGKIHPVALLTALAALLCLPLKGPIRPLFDFAFVVMLAPMIVAIGAKREPGAREVRPFVFLGAISFAIYTLHYPIIHALMDLTRGWDSGRAIAGAITVVALIVVSWLADKADVWIRSRRRPRPVIA